MNYNEFVNLGDALDLSGILTRSNMFRINDNITIKVGDDFTITSEELKSCLKVLLDLAKQKYPEDFI